MEHGWRLGGAVSRWRREDPVSYTHLDVYKRQVEDIAIREPFPRSEAFRVSPAFSLYARQLQDSLLQASQSGMEP